MYQEEEMDSSLLSLVNWVPLNFGEKDGDETTKFYRSNDIRNGQEVFVKKIDLSKDNYDEYQTEIKALTALRNNNNIVELIESGIESQMIDGKMQQFGCILLSYVGDIDLCDALAEYNWRYKEKDFITFSYKLIQVLHYIHLNGFIHRDLKLENIVLDLYSINKEKGEFSFHPESFSVIDFGSSLNYVEHYYYQKDPNLLIHFKKTQRYSSPEFINNGQLTEKYDIFSCGVILFCLIAGHFPKFDYVIGEDGFYYSFLSYKDINDFFYPNEWANVSEEIIDMIKSMLSYDPIYRPTTDDLLKMDIFQDQISHFNLGYYEEDHFF